MIKFFVVLVVGFITTLAATNKANAQNSANAELSEAPKNFNAIEQASAVNSNSATVSAKALQAFSTTYKNVAGESWEKTREGYSVKFTARGVHSIIFYSQNGVFAGSIKGYDEEYMPADVRKIVKREYHNYRITYVQEVQTPESNGIPTYIVHLENNDEITQVRVNEGQIDVWKIYKIHA